MGGARWERQRTLSSAPLSNSRILFACCENLSHPAGHHCTPLHTHRHTKRMRFGAQRRPPFGVNVSRSCFCLFPWRMRHSLLECPPLWSCFAWRACRLWPSSSSSASASFPSSCALASSSPLLLLNSSSVARRACAAGATRLFIAVLASHRWSSGRRRLPSPQQRCLSSAERMCGASLWSGRHRRGVAALGREHMEVHISLVVCPLQRVQLWQAC